MDKQSAQQLAYLIAAELVGNSDYVEEIVRREELVDDSHNADLLHDAINELREDLLERSGELREIYAEASAQLAQGDHTELLRKLRESKDLFDMTAEELLDD